MAEKQDEIRKSRAGNVHKDNLVESVTTQSNNDRDPNDNVLDRITGKETLKLGERRAADVVVPSPTPAVHAPTPAEVNRSDSAERPEKHKGKGKGKDSDSDDGDKKAGPIKPADETKGLPL